MKNLPMKSEPDMDRIFDSYFLNDFFITMRENENSVYYLSWDNLKSSKTVTLLEDGSLAYSNIHLSEDDVKIIRIRKGEYIPNKDIDQLLNVIGIDPIQNEYFEMDIYYCFKKNTVSAIRYLITSSMFERFLDLINSRQSAEGQPLTISDFFYQEKIVPIYSLLIDKLVKEQFTINFPIDFI
jgi:hypothetical protein